MVAVKVFLVKVLEPSAPLLCHFFSMSNVPVTTKSLDRGQALYVTLKKEAKEIEKYFLYLLYPLL